MSTVSHVKLEGNTISCILSISYIVLIQLLNCINMDSSDDDDVFQKEHIVYYHGNNPANSSSEIIDLTKDDTVSSDITHISETEMAGKSDTSGMYT